MIATWLVENSALARWGFVAFAAASVVMALLLVRCGRPGRGVAGLFAGTALAPIALLTLWPTSRDMGGIPFCHVEFALPSLGAVESLANIALFYPPVLFLAVATTRPALAVLAGSALSVVIELVQGAVPALGRACDTQDWLMNTVGALLTGATAVGVLAFGRMRSRPSDA